MFEIRITAPELSEAINNLAKALSCKCEHTECHHDGKTDVQIDNAGTINVAMSTTAETPTEPNPNPIAPVSVPPVVPTAPTAPSVNYPTPDVPTVQPMQPVVPTSAPQYTLDMIARAGTSLVDAGKLAEVSAILQKYGVEVLTALDPSLYGAVAMDLRALGAQI